MNTWLHILTVAFLPYFLVMLVGLLPAWLITRRATHLSFAILMASLLPFGLWLVASEAAELFMLPTQGGMPRWNSRTLANLGFEPFMLAITTVLALSPQMGFVRTESERAVARRFRVTIIVLMFYAAGIALFFPTLPE